VQFDGICNHDPETTVLHHLRRTGLTRKHDRLACWVCSDCHATIHRTINTDLDPEYVELGELRGYRRTQATLSKEGKL